MDEITQALRRLNHLTGLTLSLSDSEGEDSAEVLAQLQQLTKAYQSRYNKKNFIRELLEGRYTQREIEEHADHFHLNREMAYVLLVVRVAPPSLKVACNILKELFISRSGDEVVSLGSDQIAIMKPVHQTLSNRIAEEIENLGKMAVEALNAEGMIRAAVGCTEEAHSLEALSECYQKCLLALRIGHVFRSGKTVLFYEKLRIESLVFHLSETSMRRYLRGIYGDGATFHLDEEMTEIINAFLKNNLNLSETARQLFIHRNTLVYRIEKLHQLTGLDLRNFDDALELKIAMMVEHCLMAKETEEIQDETV